LKARRKETDVHGKTAVQHNLSSVILTEQNPSKAFLLLVLSSSFQLFSLQFGAIIFADPMTCFQIFGQKVGNSFFIKLFGRHCSWHRLDVDTIPETNSKFDPKNGWLLQMIPFPFGFRPIFV